MGTSCNDVSTERPVNANVKTSTVSIGVHAAFSETSLHKVSIVTESYSCTDIRMGRKSPNSRRCDVQNWWDFNVWVQTGGDDCDWSAPVFHALPETDTPHTTVSLTTLLLSPSERKALHLFVTFQNPIFLYNKNTFINSVYKNITYLSLCTIKLCVCFT